MAKTYINRTMEKTLKEYIGKYPVIMIRKNNFIKLYERKFKR